MTSTVNWVILGLVIERPSYGLELYHRFERFYTGVLPVSSESHVYSALDVLEERGMIEIAPGTEIGRQPRVCYQATEFGVRSYEDWFVAQGDVERRRQELWVRQLAIFARDPEAALHILDRFERQYLKGTGQTKRSPDNSPSDPRSELIDDLVDERRRIADGGMLSWLRYTHDRFAALGGRPTANDPPAT